MKIIFALMLINIYGHVIVAGDEARISERGLNQEEVDRLYEIVAVTHNIFIKHKINYRIEGGTLLGAIRHGGLIPWDDDADFDVLEEDLPKIAKLAHEFERFGMELIEIPGWGFQVSYTDSPELALTNWNGKKSKKPFLDLIAVKKISVREWTQQVHQLKDQLQQEQRAQTIQLNAKLKSMETELDAIYQQFSGENSFYVLAQESAFHDYPTYYLTEEEFNGPIENISFGGLTLNSFRNPKIYLDRNYQDWDKKIEILMDHDSNEYFDQPLTSRILSFNHKKHSNPGKLKNLSL